MEQEIEMIEEEKMKDRRGLNTCAKCGNKLSHSTFRDENGEVIGWITECLKCDIIYSEE